MADHTVKLQALAFFLLRGMSQIQKIDYTDNPPPDRDDLPAAGVSG